MVTLNTFSSSGQPGQPRGPGQSTRCFPWSVPLLSHGACSNLSFDTQGSAQQATQLNLCVVLYLDALLTLLWGVPTSHLFLLLPTSATAQGSRFIIPKASKVLVSTGAVFLLSFFPVKLHYPNYCHLQSQVTLSTSMTLSVRTLPGSTPAHPTFC